MFLAGLFRWWYVDGWKNRAQKSMNSLDSMMDYFSIGLLVRTMFALFRQDGAGSVEGALDVQIKAFFGRLISRAIGAVVRFTVLIFGMISIAISATFHFIVLALWPLVPLLPYIGFILSILEWVPWQ